MNADQLTALKERLEDQLEEVLGNLKEHTQNLNTPPGSGDFAGMDRAQELEGTETDSAIVESEENLVKKIEHALERIKSGSYGVCEECDEEIPLARLEAKPSVSLCISCQEIHES